HLAARRSSMPVKVATAKIKNAKKQIRKVVSTVKTAEARMPAKANMVRNTASRSVDALYKRTSITNSRKWTAAIRAAYRGGLAEFCTSTRERMNISRGKN